MFGCLRLKYSSRTTPSPAPKSRTLRKDAVAFGLPGVETGIVDGNSPRRQFVQQLQYCGRYLTVSRNIHSPFQILSKLLRADSPSFERRRRCRTNLNDGPMSNQCSRSVSIRQWTAYNEMVVAMHDYAYHVFSFGSFDAETRGSGTG